jgi:peptide deformylase
VIKPILTDKKILHEFCERGDYYAHYEIIDDLKDTAADLKSKTGLDCAGLAAPQIGHKKRIILVNVQAKTVIMINPEIIVTKGKFSLGNESCFSVPSSFTRPVRIKRWFKVKVKYTNEEGVFVEKLFKGFEARLIQHEIDHLDGKLIND